MDKNTFLKTLCILLFILLTSCFSYAVRYDGTYSGKVVDAVTGEPIEGVVVLGWWEKEYPTVAGPKHDYYDAEDTITDKNGEFEISGKGLRILSNLEPMRVLIFKAGYSYNGMIWKKPKEGGYIYKEDIKWEGQKAIIPLKKLTMEERRRRRPPYPPTEAPLKKIKLMLKEINKNEIELGAEPIDIWNGEKI